MQYLRRSIWLSVIVTFIVFNYSKADARTFAPLYLTTIDTDTHVSSVWRYDLQSSKAERIYSLPYGKSSVRESFSAAEFASLREYVEVGQGFAWYKEKMYDLPPSRHIAGLWRFDASHLLLLTENEVFDTETMSIHYGNYEFLLLDLNGVDAPYSLFQLDYHSHLFADGENCGWPNSKQIPLYIASVELNPKSHVAALELRSASKYCTVENVGTVLIVSLDAAKNEQTWIPGATEPLWSPDGLHLAFLQLTCDALDLRKSNDCGFNFDTRSIDGRAHRLVSYDGNLGRVPQRGYTWFNDQTLLGLARIGTGDELPAYQQFSLRTEQSERFADGSQLDIAQFYTLHSDNAVQTVLGTGWLNISGEQAIYFLSSKFPYFVSRIVKVALATIVRNSRFPDRIVLLQSASQADKDAALIINADQSIVHIYLPSLIPDDEYVSGIAS